MKASRRATKRSVNSFKGHSKPINAGGDTDVASEEKEEDLMISGKVVQTDPGMKGYRSEN